MANKKRPSWNMQLVKITEKGAEARRAGLPQYAPYGTGNNRFRGLQGQRNEAWKHGWYAADRELAEQALREQAD